MPRNLNEIAHSWIWLLKRTPTLSVSGAVSVQVSWFVFVCVTADGSCFFWVHYFLIITHHKATTHPTDRQEVDSMMVLRYLLVLKDLMKNSIAKKLIAGYSKKKLTYYVETMFENVKHKFYENFKIFNEHAFCMDVLTKCFCVLKVRLSVANSI